MKFQGSIFWNSTKYNIFAECFTFFQWKFREKESNRYPGKVCKALLIMICLLVVYNSSNPSSFPSTRIPSSFFLSSLSFSLPSPLFRSLSKFDESGDGKIAFSKFSSAENKVGRVSNGYPEYPIANLHVTETYPLPPFLPDEFFLGTLAFFASFRDALLTRRILDRAFQFPSPRIKREQADIALVTIPLCHPLHGFIYYWKKWWGGCIEDPYQLGIDAKIGMELSLRFYLFIFFWCTDCKRGEREEKLVVDGTLWWKEGIRRFVLPFNSIENYNSRFQTGDDRKETRSRSASAWNERKDRMAE